MTSKKHRVLIFGEKVFGQQKPQLSVEYCDIDIISFPNEYKKFSRLSEYDLVILDYSAFTVDENVYQYEQEIFEKQMFEALGKGTWFCFLHYDEEVPSTRWDRYDAHKMTDKGIVNCRTRQIGFRWLERLRIQPFRKELPIFDANIERNEFKAYQERWGTSKNYFRYLGAYKFASSSLIFSYVNWSALGFCLSEKRGMILYLPCQRDYTKLESIKECLEALINSIITYLTRSSAEIPPWAVMPFFSKEEKLYTELSDLQSRIKKIESNVHPYQEAKTLAFLSEYEFEEAVPKFLRTHLELPTLRNEEHKEDFWILNSTSEKIVIAETKTYVRGFKKKGIYSLYDHRESNDLDETFPALLVVNAHLNAKSWEDKLRPLDQQVSKLAAKKNILLLRIEDLILFWDSIIRKQNSTEKLLSIILNKKGWLEVQRDGTYEIHR